MHHTHTVSRVSGIVVLLLSTGAQALGLGDIEVRSKFGQPFYAEIPLELASNPTPGHTQLSADIPSHREHAMLGLENPLLVRGLRVEVVTSGAPAPHIRVTSEQPVSEPALNFLVRTRSAEGLLVREYTVLIDPPGLGKSNTTSVAAGSSATTFETYGNASTDDGYDTIGQDAPLALPTDEMRYEALSMVTARPAPVVSAGLVPIAGEVYGPVVAGETLYSIARRVRLSKPESLDAIVRRLFQTNPQAFIDGDINRLRKGAVLDMVNATPAAFASVEEPNSHTLEFVKPPPVEWSKLTRTTTGEGNPTVVEELEQKVEEAQWTLHAEQKENTTLKARLARLEERFAALQEKRAELERKEQQLTATLESLAQAETPARPQSAPASAVATTEPSGELAPSVDSGRGAAAAASERPIQAPTPEPRTLLGMTLDTAWTGLLAVLAAVLGIALLWKRRRRQTSTPAPALPRVDNSSQTPTDPPEDVHVAFLDDDAVGLDGLSIDALTNDPLTHDLSLEEEHAQDTLAEIDGEAKVIQTDAGKAQELAEEVGLYMAYGQYDRAKDTIEEAIALDPRDEHKVVLLTIYAALGEHEEAKALTQELLARRESLGDELRVQVEDITRKCA